MGAIQRKDIGVTFKLDWKFLAKLILSGILAAIGIHQRMGAKYLELALSMLLLIPAAGVVLSLLKRDMSQRKLRLMILLLATLFVLVTSELSFALALAFFLMMDGVTQDDNIDHMSAFRWTDAVEVEDAPEHVGYLIAKHRLFTSIPKENRQEFADACQCIRFNKGEKLISKGRENSTLFFIAKGHARVVGEGKPVAVLGQGDVVGEFSASGLSLPIADVIADDEIFAFALAIDKIHNAMERFPEFGERLQRLARRRRRDLSTRRRIEAPPEAIMERVSSHQLFRILPQHYRQMLVDECRVYQMEKDGLLIRQGEFNSNLYLIAKGLIHIVEDGEHIVTLGAGDIVGEISSSGISMPMADVVAGSTVIAYGFPSEIINKVSEKHPEFREKMIEIGMLKRVLYQQDKKYGGEDV